MRFLAGFLFAIVVIVLGGYGFILSGIYNIAASVPHTALAEWILRTTMQHSVKRRAADIKAPSSFSEAELNDGFQEFNEMCVSCHGAPGKDPSEIGKGLRPRPPDLAKAALQLDKGELFWIVKNGIKMTGMPAFGATHRDRTLWNIVGFVQQQLPNLTAEQYQDLANRPMPHIEHSHTEP